MRAEATHAPSTALAPESEPTAPAPAPSVAPLPPDDTGATPPAGVPAALYALLFERGRSWTFKSSLRLQTWSGPPAKPEVTRSTRTVTCIVSSVVSHAWGVASTIDCEGHEDPVVSMPIAGEWAATRLGLHHPGEVIEKEPDAKSLVIAAAPAAKHTRTTIDPEREGTWSEERVFPKGKGWCSETTYVDGDGGLSRFCFEAGRGFSSAASSFEGGHSRQYEFVPAK